MLQLALGCLTSALLIAPAARPIGTNDEPRAEIERLIAEALQNPGAVGLSVAVAVGDEFLLAGGYGLAEAEHGVEADVDTLFRIGSITKQFTAAAILRQVEAGQLELEEPLTSYLPEYPDSGDEVTLLHLLTHTSGIPSYTNLGPAWSRTVPLELPHAELLAMFQDAPLEFEPGSEYRYNNSGYYLLGMVLERQSDKSYGDHLAGTFFQPLGLARTRLGSNRDLIKNRAQGYSLIEGQLANDGLIGMSQPGAAGALLSTARELILWQRALLGGKVVSEEFYELMTTPFMLHDGRETGYGMGLQLSKLKGHPEVGHGGGINGFNSMLSYYPDQDLSVAVISNSEGYSAGQLAATISRALLP